jgi:tetratricopeptide (TPR) repeat protein
MEQARYRDAEPYLRRAVSILEAGLGPDHPDVAAVTNNVANSVMNWDPAEAQRLRRRALSVQERSLGTDHPEVANTESNLAATDFTLAHYPEAMSEVSRAIAIREKQAGQGTGELANDLDLRGELLEAIGRPGEGLAEHQRALTIREAVYGAASPFRAISLARMASAYLALQQATKGLELAREAVTLEEGTSIDPTEQALASFVLARALEATRADHDRALVLAREARRQLTAHQVEQSVYLHQMDTWLATHDPSSTRSRTAAAASVRGR